MSSNQTQVTTGQGGGGGLMQSSGQTDQKVNPMAKAVAEALLSAK